MPLFHDSGSSHLLSLSEPNGYFYALNQALQKVLCHIFDPDIIAVIAQSTAHQRTSIMPIKVLTLSGSLKQDVPVVDGVAGDPFSIVMKLDFSAQLSQKTGPINARRGIEPPGGYSLDIYATGDPITEFSFSFSGNTFITDLSAFAPPLDKTSASWSLRAEQDGFVDAWSALFTGGVLDGNENLQLRAGFSLNYDDDLNYGGSTFADFKAFDGEDLSGLLFYRFVDLTGADDINNIIEIPVIIETAGLSAIPVPPSLALMACGAALVVLRRRRKQRADV